MTLRVAITGVSGDVGMGAIRGLRAPGAPEDVWLLGLDASADCAGFHLTDAHVQLPRVAEPGYVQTLAHTLRAHRVDVLLPGIDSEILVLSRGRALLGQSGAQIALAPEVLVEAADDKLATAGFLAARGIAVPQTWDAQTADVDALPLPIIAKPRRGQASKGIVLLETRDALRAFVATQPSDYCLQAYVDGPEFTAGLLYDADGQFQDGLAMQRTLQHGRTVKATVVDNAMTRDFLAAFGARVPGACAVNAQFRVDPVRGPLVFEVNARMSGSTALRVAVGFNDPQRIAFHLGRGLPMGRASVRAATVYSHSTELVVPG